MNRTFALLALVMLVGCAGAKTKKSSEPITVDVKVSDLSSEDEDALEKELAKIPGVIDVRRDPFGGGTTFTFEYRGSYDRLRRQIANIPYPGLRPQKEVIRMSFEGFDNRAPEVALISPKDGSTINETKADIVIEVQDTDVQTVLVNDKPAKKTKQNLYAVKLTLVEGDNEITVKAADDAKNETAKKYKIKVDTTPPDLEATVKVVVEGKVEPGSTVFVDGQEASVNLFGNWRVELTVARGQKSVEVIAIDKAGNKKIEQKSIGL